MDIEVFVQNVKFFCSRRDVKPTVACRESGAGERLLENTKRGSVPSVEKVQLLARYLGVTTSELLGEAAPYPNRAQPPPPETLTLRDSAIRLKVEEVEMILAYRRADADDKTIVDAALRKYAKKESAAHEAG